MSCQAVYDHQNVLLSHMNRDENNMHSTHLPRVLIVAEHASARFGGEAILPLHYFRVLRARGVDVHLLVHERTRDELLERFPDDHDRIHFTPDRKIQVWLYHLGHKLPHRVDVLTCAAISHAITQRDQKRCARQLIDQYNIVVVHEPIPVSPKMPSKMCSLGAAVVIGPANGGMEYPPAFADRQSWIERRMLAASRAIAPLINRLAPGKLKAQTLLAANRRTADALPKGGRAKVQILVENGVDLSLWQPKPMPDTPTPRFVFLGRLVDWKGLDLLLHAIAKASQQQPMMLDVVGEGAERPALEALTKELGLSKCVAFHGFVPQHEATRFVDRASALVLPSLFECGGAVVLEAMASGRPVIATAWGGPTDYINESCGILVEPTTRDALIDGFADAMIKLAGDPELCRRMGESGRARVEQEFDWERKGDQILDIYRDAIERYRQ